MNPVSGNFLDASDKSYSFANYWSVDEFPWATVRARTYNYPFSEGDLPDRTRYVRLFFGLKGTGTLWLDNIVFRFSKWNFSALERLKPYIDRPLSPVERLNPTPKKIQPSREVVYLEPGAADGPPPLIVLPDDPAPADRAAARLLGKKLDAALARTRPGSSAPERWTQILERDLNAPELQNARLIFSIGNNRLMRRMAPELPLASISGRDQGYVIAPVETGPCHVVFLAGETAVGNFYAAATAAQLLEENHCIYHSAAVIDYPDFLGRSYLLKRWDKFTRFLEVPKAPLDNNICERALKLAVPSSPMKVETLFDGAQRAGRAVERRADLVGQSDDDIGPVAPFGELVLLIQVVAQLAGQDRAPGRLDVGAVEWQGRLAAQLETATGQRGQTGQGQGHQHCTPHLGLLRRRC